MAPTETVTTGEQPTRREREKAAHRKEIMQAAVRIFARKGFAAATMEEIAQEAEFSKGAVYLHFSSKEELLSTILVDMLQNTVVAGMQRILTGNRSLREELTELFRFAAEFAFSHQLHMSSSMPLHLCQVGSLSDDTRARVQEAHGLMVQILHDRLAKARRDGELRGVSPDVAAGLIHGTLDNMVLTRWGFQEPEGLKQAGAEVIGIFFDGIGQRKEQ